MTVVRMTSSAEAILIRLCELAGLHPDDLKGRSQTPTIQFWRRRAYLEILENKQWSARRIARFMGGRNHMQVTRALPLARQERDIQHKVRDDPQHAVELEAQLRRLSGTNLAMDVQHSLGIPLWQAIFLSILMENYPRVRATIDVCELYGEASERLQYGKGENVTQDMARAFVMHAKRKFEAMGLPKPAHIINRGLVLSDDIAPWLHNRFGKPTALPTQRLTG